MCDALLDEAHTILARGARRSNIVRFQFVAKRLAREIDRDHAMLQRGVREQLDDGAFELAHVRLHVVGDEIQNVVGNRVFEVI